MANGTNKVYVVQRNHGSTCYNIRLDIDGMKFTHATGTHGMGLAQAMDKARTLAMLCGGVVYCEVEVIHKVKK